MVAERDRRAVAIVWPFLPHYRRRFLELLRQSLLQEGVDLILVYGAPHGIDLERRHTVDLPWATRVKARHFRAAFGSVVWQPCLGLTSAADLIVVPDKARLLSTYALLARGLASRHKVALWGHGANFQARDAAPFTQFVKRQFVRRPFWWFAYNETSASVVRNSGFPQSRITVVGNTIDMRQMMIWSESVTESDREDLRAELGLGDGPVCVFVGGMYEDKRISFLISACDVIREQLPQFQMVFVGAGPDEGLVEAACRTRGWMHYAGALFGADVAPFFNLSSLLLIPGAVGLGVMDAFAYEVPLVTTAVPLHGPEIQYLESGVNGVMVDTIDDRRAYADKVVDLLTHDDSNLEPLRAGCRLARERYTVESMVENFTCGVIDALRAIAAS
jgi:glycosyltransferase involved in cell wall biosynthesis